MSGVIGLGMFWAIWNFMEIFMINYKGDNKHEIEASKSTKTLKSLPTFTR